MKILRTSDIPDDALDAFEKDLPEGLGVELDPRVYVFKSVDPPSWVKLVGDLSWWQQALSAYAALYVAEIVKEAAKESWRSRAKPVSAAVVAGTKIKRLAIAIYKLASKLKKNSDIVLFIPLPNDYFGTTLRLSTHNTELSELEIALFIHHLPQLSELVNNHSSHDAHPSTGYFLELQDDGNMRVMWYDSKTLQEHDFVLLLHAGKV